MKQFLSFVKKEFRHILRDRRTMLILLAMPIVQIVLFGFAITNEVSNVRVAVIDKSKDEQTRKLAQKIDRSEYFDITCYLDSSEEADERFKRSEIDAVIVFENNFSDNLLSEGVAQVQILADATDPNTSSMFVGYLTGIIGEYNKDMNLSSGGRVIIVPNINLLYNPSMKAAFNFVPGVMGLILTLICAMMTAISIVREKERGTMEVLLVSPVKPVWVIVAKSVPYFALSAVNLCTVLLLSVYVLSVPVAGSVILLAGLSLIFILASLGIGLFISTVTTTQVAAMLASGMVLMMPVMVLSGMIFPVENMPEPLQWFSCAIPARWYIQAVKKVMIQGLEFQYVINEIIILSAMCLGILGLSLAKFKRRL